MLKDHFTCEDIEELNDYIGCEVERDSKMGMLKLTQPVLVQSMQNEFQDVKQEKDPFTPAHPGSIRTKRDEESKLNSDMPTKYRSGVGKLMYLSKLTRPDIANAARDLARHSHCPNQGHYKAMGHALRYVRATPNRGLLLRPTGTWDGKDKDYEFVIRGRSDSNYATDPDSRKSVTGSVTYLNDAPVMYQSATQKHVTLSVTEAELAAVVSLVQGMMYCMRIVTSLGLKVKLPMLCELDNSGARDLLNSWSVGGQTRHVDVKQFYLREMKEEGLVHFKYIPGPENEADIFTKNVEATDLHRHSEKYCGQDKIHESLKARSSA
jgi:hypothetical protein